MVTQLPLREGVLAVIAVLCQVVLCHMLHGTFCTLYLAQGSFVFIHCLLSFLFTVCSNKLIQGFQFIACSLVSELSNFDN